MCLDVGLGMGSAAMHYEKFIKEIELGQKCESESTPSRRCLRVVLGLYIESVTAKGTCSAVAAEATMRHVTQLQTLRQDLATRTKHFHHKPGKFSHNYRYGKQAVCNRINTVLYKTVHNQKYLTNVLCTINILPFCHTSCCRLSCAVSCTSEGIIALHDQLVASCPCTGCTSSQPGLHAHPVGPASWLQRFTSTCKNQLLSNASFPPLRL
jgi:hypothetical protein